MHIRPAAFGAATFRFGVEYGKPHFYDIQCLGGEVLGDQTVPRSETWAAIVLLTRVSANVIARLGIDASYVTHGVEKRIKLCKGKNGNLLSLLFAILEFRTAEIEFSKVIQTSRTLECVLLKKNSV